MAEALGGRSHPRIELAIQTAARWLDDDDSKTAWVTLQENNASLDSSPAEATCWIGPSGSTRGRSHDEDIAGGHARGRYSFQLRDLGKTQALSLPIRLDRAGDEVADAQLVPLQQRARHKWVAGLGLVILLDRA